MYHVAPCVLVKGSGSVVDTTLAHPLFLLAKIQFTTELRDFTITPDGEMISSIVVLDLVPPFGLP